MMAEEVVALVPRYVDMLWVAPHGRGVFVLAETKAQVIQSKVVRSWVQVEPRVQILR